MFFVAAATQGERLRAGTVEDLTKVCLGRSWRMVEERNETRIRYLMATPDGLLASRSGGTSVWPCHAWPDRHLWRPALPSPPRGPGPTPRRPPQAPTGRLV